MKRRVLVCGSRNWHDPEAIYGKLRELDASSWEVIHGGARGADVMADRAASRLGLATQSLPPDYQAFGKDAPHVRNDEMLKLADRVIAFWDGSSSGTKSVIEKARRAGIPVEVEEAS